METSWRTAGLILFSALSVYASIIDIKYRRIPNRIVLSGILSITALILLFCGRLPHAAAVSFFTGGGVFFGVRFITKGKLGMGDVKFSAMTALFTGFRGWILTVGIASVMGLLFALSGIAAGKLNRKSKIPFAPFFTAGAVAAFFIQPESFQYRGCF